MIKLAEWIPVLDYAKEVFFSRCIWHVTPSPLPVAFVPIMYVVKVIVIMLCFRIMTEKCVNIDKTIAVCHCVSILIDH